MMVLVYKVLLSSDEFELFEGLTYNFFLSLRFYVKSYCDHFRLTKLQPARCEIVDAFRRILNLDTLMNFCVFSGLIQH